MNDTDPKIQNRFNAMMMSKSGQERLKMGFSMFNMARRQVIASIKIAKPDADAREIRKPVVVGTRITVELILDKLAAGETVEQILEAHPRLTHEGIQAAMAFAADVLKGDVVYPAAEAPDKKAEIVVSIFKKHFDELMEAFSVITPMGIRIRHQKI